MATNTDTTKQLNIEKIVNDVLGTIDREREREIVARRYGLFDRKETLEQIGELLGITRERVRQLEKAVLARLKAMAQDELPYIKDLQEKFVQLLLEHGHSARMQDLSARLTQNNSREDQSRVSFLAELSPKLTVIEENDHFYLSAGIKSDHDEKAMKS